MSGIKDTATVTLNVNGAQAKQMMSDLEAKIKQTEVRISSLKANMADPKDIEKARKQLQTYQKQLDEMKSATEGVNKALSNLDYASPRALEKALRTLNKQLKDMTPGTEVWESHVNKIKELKERLSEIRDELKVQESWWSKLKSWINDSGATILALGLGFDEVVGSLRSYVDAYASMDQEMANVRKFTGMTEEQVADLNEEFKKIDTRTSREELNKLAQEAGRLGKSSEDDVLGFVRAADQINVALDDLGEDAALQLSKLTGIFGDEARFGTEQSLLKVGSVINELSQNCSASAPFLADFASRMGGVGAQAKMTIPQIMAFGAVLDSNGQAVEASSTALSQVIVRMMQEPAKYAKVAGLDVQKFTEMLKNDVNGALILFMETLQKAGGMNVLSPMFADMGENGARAIATLSTLATHIDEVKTQQEVANQAFIEGTSIGKEFSVQNNTVQAGLDKCKNAANDLRVTLGKYLAPLMSHFLTSGSAIMRALLTIIDFTVKHKNTIITITAAIAAYTAVLEIHTLWLKRSAIATMLNEKASKLWAVAQKMLNGVIGIGRVMVTALTNAFQYLTNGLEVNYAMQQRWRVAMAAINWQTWTAGVLAAAAAITILYTKLTDAFSVTKMLNQVEKEANKTVAEQTTRINELRRAVHDQNLTYDERLKAIKELESIVPGYHASLTKEGKIINENTVAIDRYIDAVRRQARVEAARAKLVELEKERLDIETDVETDSQGLNVERAIKSGLSSVSLLGIGTAIQYGLQSAVESGVNQAKLAANQQKIEALGAIVGNKITTTPGKVEPEIAPEIEDVDQQPYTPYISEKERKKAEKERKKQEAEARREAAKAKKEFKAELDSYKAQKSAADAEALDLYRAGSIDYEELIRRQHENELKYYNDSLAYFEKTFGKRKDTYLQDDKDYQKLLLDREKSEESYEKKRITLALESIENRKSAEEKSAQHAFNVKSNPTVKDEIALQAELYRIRRQALDEKLALYTAGSKEYASVQREITTLEQDQELSLKKTYFKAVSALRKEYDKTNAAERFLLEKATLDALLAAEILSFEEYSKYLNGLTEKYKSQLPGGADPDKDYSWTDKKQKKYDDDKKELADALASNLITQAEYYKRLANLDSETRKQMLKGLKESGGEWNAMLSDVYLSFSDLMESLQSSPEDFLGKLSDCVAAVSAVVSAGMQIASEFAKAESQIQLSAIEKRYSREIELAQGNSYKTAKLEKEKEAKVNKIKSESAKKEFATKVLMGIAQTAQNALMAYSAGLQFPFPANTVMPPILAGIAVAQGAVQIALLKKQQQAAAAQGYSKGGFTKPGAVDEPAGIVHAGEWIASQKLLSNPVTRPMIDALDYAQRTNTIGSLRPEDVSRSIRANDSLARIAENDPSAALLVAAAARMSDTVDNLTDRLNKPFVTVNTVTGDRGIKQAQDEYSRLMDNITPKSKRSRK